MTRALKPRFFSYAEVRRRALEYAGKCGLATGIPVDVDRLIDNILKINVIPFPSLYKSFEIDAFISNDFQKIYIDEYLYVNLEPQYRFTLAHELGHMVLHKEYYRQFRIESLNSYIDFVSSVDNDEYKLLETQANYFAGLFLVPSQPLEVHFREQAKEIVRFISLRFKGLKRDQYLGTAVELIGQKLSPIFKVHHLPIQFRIEKDGLADLIP